MREEDFRRDEEADLEREEDFDREDDFEREADFFAGTLPPALRASESPIAIACLRLVTFLPERPLRSLPRFISCIDFSTFFEAFFPYFAITRLLSARPP